MEQEKLIRKLERTQKKVDILEHMIEEKTRELFIANQNLKEKYIQEQKMIQEKHRLQVQAFNTSKLATLGEMAAGVAHEINNPLTIINGVASRIRKQCNNSEDKEAIFKHVDKLESVVERISGIIRGLLTFAREGHNDPLELVPLADIIRDALSYNEQKFKTHHIDVRKINCGIDLDVRCRKIQIAQVLMNLLNNAYHAVRLKDGLESNEGEKWVEVSVSKGVDTVTVSVIDSGAGVPEEIRDKIMNPFFTTKEVGKGTGLGLSISQGIIKDHGGTLVLDIKYPNTKFDILLPV